MSASRPQPVLPIFDGEVIPWDDQGYPLIFWSQKVPKLCAACATAVHKHGGKVLVHYAIRGGNAECGRCKTVIHAIEGEDEGDGDCDAEVTTAEDEPAEFPDHLLLLAGDAGFDPTNTDWEPNDWDRECDDEPEDGGDAEESPAVVQLDWEKFEVSQ